jgi:hypothetical protein
MLESKAPVAKLEWQFAQKIITKASDNTHHQFCKQMMSAVFQIQIITCAN